MTDEIEKETEMEIGKEAEKETEKKIGKEAEKEIEKKIRKEIVKEMKQEIRDTAGVRRIVEDDRDTVRSCTRNCLRKGRLHCL